VIPLGVLWLLAPWFAVSVACGDDFTCAIARGGGVRCWGANATAELGDGTTQKSSVPVALAIGGVSQLTAGSHACAVAGGRLQCWGGDFWVGQHTRPRPIARYGRVTSASVGGEYTCAVGSDKKVLCGGSGEGGELVAGMDQHGHATQPAFVTGLDAVKQVAAGSFHACALGTDGRVRCWGANSWSHFVPGSERSIPLPRSIEKLDLVDQIAVGTSDTCALRKGEVFCWGENLAGRLGDGTREDRDTPMHVNGLPPIVAISAGASVTCALDAEGDVWCWGDNVHGNVGSPGYSAAPPRRVSGVRHGKSISCGRNHCCATDAEGRAWCWGSNELGQLGTGKSVPQADSPAPVVQGL
jgi:alpha-tubulin suppressor-like RCC1 family protein